MANSKINIIIQYFILLFVETNSIFFSAFLSKNLLRVIFYLKQGPWKPVFTDLEYACEKDNRGATTRIACDAI